MMLEFLGEPAAAAAVEEAIRRALTEKHLPSLGADSGLKTSEIGDLLARLTAASFAGVAG